MAASRPNTTRFVDIPSLQVWRNSDRKQQVDEIMRAHDYGAFSTSAPFVDELYTDDRIAGVLSTRVGGLLASPLTFTPGLPGRKAKKLADQVGGTEDVVGAWGEMIAPSTIKEILSWGLALGVAVAEIVWSSDDDGWRPRLIPVHPQFVRWDWSLRRFVIQGLASYQIPLPRPDEQPHGDGKWFVWTPHGVQYGWRRALVRPLAQLYLGRQWNYRDWARYNERHGLAIVNGKVPSDAPTEEKTAFFDALANLGNEAAVISPQGTADQPGFGVELVEAVAKTWDTFEAFKKQLDTDIAIAVLGQNLTTEVQGGSRSAAEVQNLVRVDKMAEDALIARAIRDQVLWWHALYNIGDGRLAPIPAYQYLDADDELKEATTLKTMGEAVTALIVAEPRTDSVAILEKYGVPMLEESEVDPEPGSPPDGETPPADGQVPDAKLVGLDGGTRLKRTVTGNGRAARYEDRLTKRAAALAARTMNGDLARIKEQIDASTSLEDARARVLRAFEGMDPEKLAKVVARAGVMANLAGKRSALEAI